MKKHLSVFALMIRQSAVKMAVLVAVSLSAQLAAFLFTFKSALSKAEFGEIMLPLESIIEKSKIKLIFGASFLILVLILCLVCRSSSSKAVYTLRRLSVSRKSVVLWQTAAGVFYCFILLSAQIAAVIAFSAVYVKYAPKEALSSQTVFLAFYKNSFLHALLPLEFYSVYLRNAVLIICISISTAVFCAYSQVGKISMQVFFITPLTVLCFCAALAQPGVDVAIIFYALWIIVWCVCDIFKKEGGINEEV